MQDDRHTNSHTHTNGRRTVRPSLRTPQEPRVKNEFWVAGYCKSVPSK